jgi:hypothetical protein
MRAKNVVNNLVVSSSTQSLSTMGQLIGTNWRILRRGIKRRTQLEDGTNMQWALSVRAKRRDVLTKDVIDAVVEFLTNETKVNPNKWDIMKHHIMKNRWKEHAIHFLKNQKYIFPNFFNLTLSVIVLFFVSACCIIPSCSWGFRFLVVKDIIVWKHMFTISSN